MRAPSSLTALLLAVLLSLLSLSSATSLVCGVSADEFAALPVSVQAEPISITFVAGFEDTERVSSLFRAEIAAAISAHVSRVCVSTVTTVSGRVVASVLFLPDTLVTSDGPVSALRSAFFAQATAQFSSSPLAQGVVGANVDALLTADPGTGVVLRRCVTTQALQSVDLPCAGGSGEPGPSAGGDPNNEAGSGLAWGLGAASVGFTFLCTLFFYCGYSRYEAEAAEKQADKITEHVRRQASQVSLGSLSDRDD